MISKIGYLSIFFILASSLGFGYVEIGEDGFLEKIEPIVEVVNLLISVFTAVIAALILPRLAHLGPLIKKALKYLIAVAGIFALFEVLQILTLLKIFKWHGLADILELLFIIMLFFSIYFLKKFIDEISNLKEIIAPKIVKTPGKK